MRYVTVGAKDIAVGDAEDDCGGSRASVADSSDAYEPGHVRFAQRRGRLMGGAGRGFVSAGG